MTSLASCRSALRSRMKTEPESHRSFIRNVIANLNAIDSGPPDQREAAKAQLERNIEMLERARRQDVA